MYALDEYSPFILVLGKKENDSFDNFVWHLATVFDEIYKEQKFFSVAEGKQFVSTPLKHLPSNNSSATASSKKNKRKKSGSHGKQEKPENTTTTDSEGDDDFRSPAPRSKAIKSANTQRPQKSTPSTTGSTFVSQTKKQIVIDSVLSQSKSSEVWVCHYKDRTTRFVAKLFEDDEEAKILKMLRGCSYVVQLLKVTTINHKSAIIVEQLFSQRINSLTTVKRAMIDTKR